MPSLLYPQSKYTCLYRPVLILYVFAATTLLQDKLNVHLWVYSAKDNQLYNPDLSERASQSM